MHDDPVIAPEALVGRLDDFIILDARSGPNAQAKYDEAHLRGAHHLDLEGELSGDKSHPEQGGRHPLPNLDVWCREVGRRGITPKTPVLVYDDMGGIKAAARVWWMLRAIGHHDVWVVDGGLEAAIGVGLPTDAEPPTLVMTEIYPATEWIWPTVGVDEVEQLLKDGGILIDVRAENRYAGEVEPFDPIPGHIAGAINIPCIKNLENGRFRSRDELRKLYASIPEEGAVVSCGSGVTACHTILAMIRAGRPVLPLYVGSYGEWCRQGRPTEPGGKA